MRLRECLVMKVCTILCLGVEDVSVATHDASAVYSGGRFDTRQVFYDEGTRFGGIYYYPFRETGRDGE